MDLQGRVVVITGGAVRIGRVLSLAMARAGMRVCVHYGSSAEAAEDVANQIQSKRGEAVTIQADLAKPESAAKTIMSETLDAFGRVDVLINNASIFEAGCLEGLTPEDWHRHHTINLEAPAFLCREFAAAKCQDDSEGAIINIADWRALRPQRGHLSYTVSKAGLVALTEVLALELAPKIRVNAIAPGAILPPIDAEEGHHERIKDVIPLRKTGSAESIAEAALFLLQSDFITGEILHITGGQQLTVPLPKDGP